MVTPTHLHNKLKLNEFVGVVNATSMLTCAARYRSSHSKSWECRCPVSDTVDRCIPHPFLLHLLQRAMAQKPNASYMNLVYHSILLYYNYYDCAIFMPQFFNSSKYE